jgi:hypothetical protein
MTPLRQRLPTIRLIAIEFDHQGVRAIEAETDGDDLHARERELFLLAEEIPHWKLAEDARTILFDLTRDLLARVPSPDDSEEVLRDLDAGLVRCQAIVTAAAIAVRAIGSGMSLIACGYGAEAGLPTRRLAEARLSALKITDDESGGYARRYLMGRGSKLSTLASDYPEVAAEYDYPGGVNWLSNFAHAGPLALLPLSVSGDGVNPGLVLEPARQDARSRAGLFLFAFDAIQMCELVPQPFGRRWAMPPDIGEALRDAGADVGRKVRLLYSPP